MAPRFYPIAAISNLVIVLIGYVINALSGTGPDGVIFHHSNPKVADYFHTVVTPAGWTFSIWGAIYIWQGVWVVYTVVNIFRKDPESGARVYYNPVFIPTIVPVLCSGSVLCGIGWLVSFDRYQLELAYVFLLVYVSLMFLVLGVQYKALDLASPELDKENRALDIWLTRGFVLNGLSMQATWVCLATLLNLTMILTYSGDRIATQDEAGTAFLSIVFIAIVALAVSDLFFLDRYTRYTVTPYIVLVVALSGSLSKNYEKGASNSNFTIVLLVASITLLLVKIAVTVVRHNRRSRYRTYESHMITNDLARTNL